MLIGMNKTITSGLGLSSGIPLVLRDSFANRYSLDFDGVNDYATTASNISLTRGFTVSWWATNEDGTSSSQTIFGSGGSYDYFLINHLTRDCRLVIGGGSIKSFPLPALDSGWHRFRVTRDSGNQVQFYVDDAHQTYGSPLTDSGRLTVNQISLDSGTQLDGNLKDFSIWNIDVDDSKVNNGGKPADLSGESSLLNWWRFGDGDEGGSGTTVYDMHGSNNFTIYNETNPNYEEDSP